MSKIINLNVDINEANKRVDVFISEKIENLSRSQVQKLIEDDKIFVNDKKIKSNYKIKDGDLIAIEIPDPVKIDVAPEDIDIEILYEDEDIVVVNKSQGMVVHPAAGNYTGTLVNALLSKCSNLSGINGAIRPGIVHRIDKDTSGVLVVAKNDIAHQNLSNQIKEHSVNRIYIALVEGIIKNDSGVINLPIGRHPVERKKMAVVSRGGRNAVTHFKVIERFKENTLIEARLETGRTHQIRVHMAYIGHPLVGDPVYGYKKQKYKLKGQALHAMTLGFIHPTKNVYMEFTAPLPEYFNELIRKLRNS
ncbi:ribosomal large subunit pseudouridine synthase D [Caloramator quimbayensis]|uniref:Pseudouridine synthase n=1 Tax=Caloramator quimbayensis TaxID=1147123 RepID=A0A1T4X1T8_9CLOT|nr:RluA family pseudouridine synthase [Caloramator quimbayensis]SKA83613.1 ribosomal large subunit pseudouridine synthase D [Caloramator quimbayensis]